VVNGLDGSNRKEGGSSDRETHFDKGLFVEVGLVGDLDQSKTEITKVGWELWGSAWEEREY
jgi:hypothetical protein